MIEYTHVCMYSKLPVSTCLNAWRQRATRFVLTNSHPLVVDFPADILIPRRVLPSKQCSVSQSSSVKNTAWGVWPGWCRGVCVFACETSGALRGSSPMPPERCT